MRSLFLAFIFFCVSIAYVSAQETKIDVNFTRTSATEVAKSLSIKTQLKFYYKTEVLDTIYITKKIDDQPFNLALKNIFEGTNIKYTIYKNAVYLTLGEPLGTAIAEEFYEDNKTVEDVASFITIVDDRKNLNATTPNKLYEIGIKSGRARDKITVDGYVREATTGNVIAGAKILSSNGNVSANSNQLGYYSIVLPAGKTNIIITAPGKDLTTRTLLVHSSGRLNFEVKERILTLKEINILANKASVVKSTEMGTNKIDLKALKKIPALFGEPDVLRAVLTLPGVQSVGEASTGFNVRGGSTDQNLILLNDATIYNPSHFFGFFSAFNPDLVKDVQLYKSTIPEKFGGRLSSVLEVNNREGNKDKLSGSAGIGIITSRVSLEGPIVKDKTSFIVGARGTYADWLLKLLPEEYENSAASFYDFNLGISHQFNKNNQLIINGYYSKDEFKLNSDTSYSYSNKNASIKWKHNFSEKLNMDVTLGTDLYNYDISSDVNPVNAYKLKFDIKQKNFKTDFVYGLNNTHTLKFGLSAINYNLSPGEFKPFGSESLVISDVVPDEQALESAIYLGDEIAINDKFSVNMGVRYSVYNYLGPQTVREYAPNLPINDDNVIGEKSFGKNKVVNTYHAPEFRLAARYLLANDFSIKASFNTLRQYIHLLSNTTAIAPTDIYKLSDPTIKPQQGNQLSLGLYKNLASQSVELSVEGYYKQLKDYLDYKSGASLVMNQHIETDVLGTRGKAYGIEFFVKKNAGKLTGWMSYAFSRTMLKMDDPLNDSPINDGEYYPANHDKPHSFNFTGNYAFKRRYSLSLNVTYSTGRPITLPIAKYVYGGSERVYYSDRNAYRIPDYFRTDIAFNIEGNHKINQTFHNSFTFGLYNITGRKNAYSTYFSNDNGVINGFKLSIFASIMPFVSYNIKF
ncbi:TonB-dependent receptor [Pedobacter namyangjuensis]|uniref:TonB-dependent receptor n=1 Tax=Pedobacter namyangjuensis TaxID=600626 RepID=UPI000DE32D10|nr:TonB-dependent receptor [Pedobacter namyangjuensis]